MPVSVLLIEPDDSSRDLLATILRFKFPQLEITAVGAPVDAMRMMRKARYDLIVCEVLLASGDRIRFFHELCGEQRETSLLIITADTRFKREDLHAPERGLCVHGVVYKPVMIETLLTTLQEAIADAERRQSQG